MVVPGSRSAELSLSQTKVKIAALQECKLVPTVVTLLYLKEKKNTKTNQPQKHPPNFSRLTLQDMFQFITSVRLVE